MQIIEQVVNKQMSLGDARSLLHAIQIAGSMLKPEKKAVQPAKAERFALSRREPGIALEKPGLVHDKRGISVEISRLPRRTKVRFLGESHRNSGRMRMICSVSAWEQVRKAQGCNNLRA